MDDDVDDQIACERFDVLTIQQRTDGRSILPAFLADQLDSTVLALNIEAAGHNVWVLEVYLLGI